MIFIPSFLRLGTWNIWEEDADFGDQREKRTACGSSSNYWACKKMFASFSEWSTHRKSLKI